MNYEGMATKPVVRVVVAYDDDYCHTLLPDLG